MYLCMYLRMYVNKCIHALRMYMYAYQISRGPGSFGSCIFKPCGVFAAVRTVCKYECMYLTSKKRTELTGTKRNQVELSQTMRHQAELSGTKWN